MNSSIDTLSDTDLDLAIGAACLDNDHARLQALEAEHDRRRRDEARQRLARAATEQRTAATARAERDRLLASLLGQRDRYRAEYQALLTEVATAADKHALVARAYEVGRQAYSLGHDLASVTGDRRLGERYRVPDELIGVAGRVAEAFLASIRGRAYTVPTPWVSDLEALRQLTPRTTRVANGG